MGCGADGLFKTKGSSSHAGFGASDSLRVLVEGLLHRFFGEDAGVKWPVWRVNCGQEQVHCEFFCCLNRGHCFLFRVG